MPHCKKFCLEGFSRCRLDVSYDQVDIPLVQKLKVRLFRQKHLFPCKKGSIVLKEVEAECTISISIKEDNSSFVGRVMIG